MPDRYREICPEMTTKIRIGPNAGGGFHGAALVVAYHAERVEDGTVIDRGFFIKRKKLVDRAAFNYDPTMGWERDQWFEWESEKK